jgi:hypothetical protein
MPWVAFSISRPMTSGMSFWVSWARVHELASRAMISTIFLRMALICDVAAYVVFLIWFGRRLVKAMAKRRRR